MTSPELARIAPISRRAIGYLIDAFIAAALAIVLYGAVVVAATLAGSGGMLGVLVFGGAGATVILLAWFLVYTFMQSRSGSVGMRAQGLRLVAEQGDAPLGFPRTLLRNVVFGLACSVVVGYVTPLFDGSGRFQGWHDKVARSLMLDARAADSSGIAAVPAATAETPAPRKDRLDAAAPAPSDRLPPPFVPPGSPPAAPTAPPQSASSSVASSAEAVAASAPAGEDGLIAYVPGVTRQPSTPLQAPAPAPAPAPALSAVAAPAAAPAPAPSPIDTDLDQTLVGKRAAADDIDDTRISIPGHRLVFTWDDGTRVSVSRPTVFGRNPAAPDGAVAVPVRDETLSLSKTHFEAAAEPSGGWIVDRHSTNGTTLVRGGERIACPPGQRVPVRLGDVIEIGDRIVTIGGYA